MSDAERVLLDYTLHLAADELDARVLHQAKRRLLDSLGCALGAYAAEPVKIARGVTPRIADGPRARVWGSLAPTTLDGAAFVNGVMVRYLDFNDTYRTVDGAHPSDNLPALVAVAEAERSSGLDFLVALAIAYEVQCRFVDCVALNARGWDMPVSGAIATALGCGRLMRLDSGRLYHALAMAAISNICTYQSRAGELSMWKGCAAANGARQGVFAAMLARDGMTGPSSPFDGEYGLWPQTMGAACELKGFARRGQKFGLMQSNIKQFPVKDSLQLPAATAVQLHGRMALQDIEQVRVETYRSAYKGAAADAEFWCPQTRETADHSMPFCIAAGVLDGAIDTTTFDRERFRDDDVKALLGRCKVDVAPDFTAQAPAVRNCRITLVARDGRTEQAHRTLTFDDIERGLDDAELEAKFRRLTGAFLTARQQADVIAAVQGIEHCTDMRDFVDLLAV